MGSVCCLKIRAGKIEAAAGANELALALGHLVPAARAGALQLGDTRRRLALRLRNFSPGSHAEFYSGFPLKTQTAASCNLAERLFVELLLIMGA